MLRITTQGNREWNAPISCSSPPTRNAATPSGAWPNADPADPAVAKLLRENYEAIVDGIKATGFDYAASVYQGNVPELRVPAVLRVHNMEWVTQGALDFLHQNKDRPFFLYVAPTLVHAPDAIGSMNQDPRRTPAGLLEKAPDCQPSRKDVLDRVAPSRAARKMAGAVWLDDGVGAILKKLDDLNLAQNTLVWLISDNGNRPKFTCYDGAARLPSLVRWRGVIPAGRVCRDLACSVDVAPTVLALCGAAEDPDCPTDGQDITKALKGDGAYSRESVYLEITTERAVVTKDGYKYIAVRYLPEAQKQIEAGKKLNHWCRPLDDHTYNADAMPGYFDPDQLYDLKRDPRERRNLATDPASAERLKKVKEVLEQYCQKLPNSFGEFKGDTTALP